MRGVWQLICSSSSSSRESSSRRWLSERSGTRVVVRKLWHLTMRASRTGVINLKPIGDREGRGREERANDTTTIAAGMVVTNYLDARGIRVANAVGTRAARHAWQVQLVYHCGMYHPQADDEPRERNFRSPYHAWTKQVVRMFGFPWTWYRRWPADRIR